MAFTSGVRAPGSAQKRHLEALVDRFLPDPSADARTPQNGVLSALFAPRSLQEGQRDRENKARAPFTQSDHFRNVRWITRPPQGARSVGIALSWCRWTPTTALPIAWRFWRSPGAQNQGCTQKTYNMVGDILDTLFLTTLTSAVYANSSSQQL